MQRVDNKKGQDSANVNLWNGQPKTTVQKKQYSGKAVLADRKLSDGDPSFTPDMLNTIKAKWLVIQGDDEPMFLYK